MAKNKEEFISEIAKDLYLKDEVVSDVINRFRDLLIEDLVNSGNVTLQSLFSVETKSRKGYKTGIGEVKEANHLIIRLSPTIKKLFREKQNNSDLSVTKDNWHEAYLSTL